MDVNIQWMFIRYSFGVHVNLQLKVKRMFICSSAVKVQCGVHLFVDVKCGCFRQWPRLLRRPTAILGNSAGPRCSRR